MKSYTYRVFDSVSTVLFAARQVERNGIECKVVPIPRQFSSDCGVCLRNMTDTDSEVVRVLNGRGLRETDVHRLELA